MRISGIDISMDGLGLYWTIPGMNLCLKCIPVINIYRLQVSFLPVPIAQLLLFAGYVRLEALRITKDTTF